MKQSEIKLKLFFLFGLLIINLLVYYLVFNISRSNLSVTFLDVGQGDAIFIKAPNGRQMLIDGGLNGNVLRELGKVMPFYDRSIDVVVATHADQDHIGGLVEVLKRFEVRLFVQTDATSSSAVYAELEKVINDKNIQEEIITHQEMFDLGQGAGFYALFPDKSVAGWETNDSSIVGRVIYGNSSFMLTGDSPKKIEKYLVGKYGEFLKSDVLKAGHHGSKSSNSEIFIKAVSPDYTVISAGLDNRYGHPNKEVMDLLNSFQEKVLQTLDGGMIRFETDGNVVNVR